MKIDNNIMGHQIIIFNNEFFIECDDDSLKRQNDSSHVSNKTNKDIPEDKDEEEIELDIYFENDKKIQTKLKLDRNFYNNVDSFCNRNNISTKDKDLILENIDIKVRELIEQKTKTIEDYNHENKNESKKKKKNKIKIKVHKKKLKGDEIGKKMYERGMKFLLKNKIKTERMRTEIINHSPKYNFRPQLSKKSIDLTKRKNRKKIKVEDRLIMSGKEKEKKMLRKKLENSFLEENHNNGLSFTYHKNKNRILKRNKSEDIFNKLYNEKDILKAKAEKENKKCLKERYPFKPEITKMAKNMGCKQYKEIIDKYNDKIKKRNDEISKEKNNTINKTTTKLKKSNNQKQKNFIYRNIKAINNIHNKQINYSLYGNNKQDQSYNIFNKEIEDEKIKNFDIKSNDIINKMKENKFKEIFDELDRNKKGYLSYSNITFKNVEPHILEAISPITDEINRNKTKKINFNEFKMLINESLSKCMFK